MTDLNIGVERGEAATLVVLRGDLDIVTAPELRECLVKVIDEGARVVIDLEAVGFLDSAGLGILVGGLKRARTRGGELELVSTSHDVLKPLEITGLDRVFTIHAGRDAALGG
ncbi:MAG TPA: STAS domain-containing protein [Solirubrobacteraceae bacterium]|nr:STAS domain-containing protein [Solirubrobacteraceae bacterium]